jgi:hypothetical protein
MASTITVAFEFELGELVYGKSARHCMGVRPRPFCILERHAVEYVGGIERLYRLDSFSVECIELFPEIALTRVEPKYCYMSAEAKDEVAHR